MIITSLLRAALASSLALAATDLSVVQDQPSAFPADPTSPVLRAGVHRIVASDGSELHAKVSGTGPPCLFVHGGPGQGSASFEQMGGSELEAFLTMIYLDQRGSGRSPDASDYSLDRVVEDIEETRQQLGVETMCLIAHSFGGILAVEYARRRPERVSQIVMAFSTLHFVSEEADRMQIALVEDILGREIAPGADTADRDTIAAANETARAALMASGQGYRFLTRNPDTTRRMSEIDGGYSRSRGFGSAIIDLLRTDTDYYRDYAPASAEIDHPVLVIAGTEDYAIGPDEHRRYRFPHQTVVVLDTGHMGFFDANPEFVQAIRQFMNDADLPD